MYDGISGTKRTVRNERLDCIPLSYLAICFISNKRFSLNLFR